MYRSKTPTADLYSNRDPVVTSNRPKTPIVDTRQYRSKTPTLPTNISRPMTPPASAESRVPYVLDSAIASPGDASQAPVSAVTGQMHNMNIGDYSTAYDPVYGGCVPAAEGAYHGDESHWSRESLHQARYVNTDYDSRQYQTYDDRSKTPTNRTDQYGYTTQAYTPYPSNGSYNYPSPSINARPNGPSNGGSGYQLPQADNGYPAGSIYQPSNSSSCYDSLSRQKQSTSFEHEQPSPSSITRIPRSERPGSFGVGRSSRSFQCVELLVTLQRQDSGFGFRIVGGTEEGSQVQHVNVIFFLISYSRLS